MTALQIVAAFRAGPVTADRAKKVPRLVSSPTLARDVVAALTSDEAALILPLLQAKFGSF